MKTLILHEKYLNKLFIGHKMQTRLTVRNETEKYTKIN